MVDFAVRTGGIGSIWPHDQNPRIDDQVPDIPAGSVCSDEVWAAIPGYEGLYEISQCGRVRRSSKSRMAPAGYLLKPRLTRDGYLRYGLSRHQRYWHVTAHRLVALTFLGPPPFPGAHVAHYDGEKTNNHVSNLRWATPAENEADKRRHGRVRGAPPGEKHPMAKLRVGIVREMRRLAASGMSVTAIGKRLGVAKLTAYDAIRGKTWKTVTEPPPVPCQKGRKA